MKKTFITPIILLLLISLFSSCTTNDINVSPSPDSNSSGQDRLLTRFAIVDSTMYFVDNSTIRVYDISESIFTNYLRTVNIPSNTIETISHFDDYLYLGSSDDLFIYNISNPKQPEFVSSAPHATGCDPVVIDGKYAYVTIRNSEFCNRFRDINILEIFDVTDQYNPISISITELEFPQGLAIVDQTLYVCDNGIKAIDVSDPTQPIILKTFPSTAFDLIKDGNYLLAVTNDGIEQYKIDPNNNNLTLLTTIQTKK